MNLIDGLEELSEALSGETDISSFIIFAKEKKHRGKALRVLSGNLRELLIAYAIIGIHLAEESGMLSIDNVLEFVKEYARVEKKEE